jgi:hypothetical protein
MIARTLQPVATRRAQSYPVVTITGPRQSGKTTLARATFPDHAYASLEDPDQRAYAREDPRGFLGQFPDGVILDEIQRAPDLPSYIQTSVDTDPRAGRFILTGSQNLLLLRSVSQSLAGRASVLHLLPLSSAEIQGRAPLDMRSLGRELPAGNATPRRGLMESLFTGSYPRIHDAGLDPTVWLGDYYRTYVERDVREVLNVGDLEAFGRFVRLCAGRTGQLLSLSGIASDTGVSHTTARRWLSVLEASFLVFLLRPHHRSFSKRLVKSPKLYFMDTGLACYLLRIRSPEELRTHSTRGALFETFVLSEMMKACYHRGEEPDLYFWRDSTGHEMDALVDLGEEQIPVEAKSGETVAGDFLDALRYWRRLVGDEQARGALVYGGDRSFMRDGFAVYAWSDL